MTAFKCFTIVISAGLSLITSNIEAQTLFSAPDTSPDYPKYKYIEQCQYAALRINTLFYQGKDSIWSDTLTKAAAKKRYMTSKDGLLLKYPEPVTDTLNICLSEFGADTVKLTSLDKTGRMIQLLLFANRDQDADRIAKRYLDSLQRETQTNSSQAIRKRALRDYKMGLAKVGSEYGKARPIRYNVWKEYVSKLLKEVENDSAYYTIDVALAAADIYGKMEDSAEHNQMWNLAIRLNDSIPQEERARMPGAILRLSALVKVIVAQTQYEALDSIAVSTVAYNLWYANTVNRRIYGGEIVTREKAQPIPLPKVAGSFYYIADNMVPDTVRNGFGKYSSKGPVKANDFPIKNKINYYIAMPSLSHTLTVARTSSDDYKKVDNYHRYATQIRQLKKDYPDIEIIGLSSTYGTVGNLGPLKPDQEADTLAKYYLGFHHMPAHLVVEKTEFFNLSAPDSRRVDFPTRNSESFRQSTLDVTKFRRLTDKEGNMLLVPDLDEDWFGRFIKILRDRPSPK